MIPTWMTKARMNSAMSRAETIQRLKDSLEEALRTISGDNWSDSKQRRAMRALAEAEFELNASIPDANAVPASVPTSVPSLMRRVTSDPTDPRLTHGADVEPTGQAEVYLVLSDEERSKGFVRPVRRSYRHATCGAVTTMGLAIAETYARDPKFYGATYCCVCQKHLPLSEFTWDGTTEVVGS